MATVPGIDVSYWDAGIDWPKVRATGQRYVFAKATEGVSYKDPTFDDNWLGAKSAGLLRGAYHFFHCNVDAKKQANYFIDYVRTLKDDGELPPVLDLEVNDGMTKDKIVPAVKTWLDTVEDAFGKKPIIYSGQYFLQDYLSIAGGGPPSWAKDYPLWLAQYPGAQYQDGMQPALPRGWFSWTFWQYSDKGVVNGINAKVDMNVYNGTLADLYKLGGAQPPDTKPKTYTVKQGDTFESISTAYGVTVRELVSANLQLLKAGETLTIPVAIAINQEGGGSNSGGGGGSGGTSARTYTIQPGDTLTSIAVKTGSTVAAIAAANNIANINIIKVGQVLVIP